MSLNVDASSWARVRFGDVVANINDYFSAERDGTLPFVAGPHIAPGRPTVTSYGSTGDDDFPPTFKRKFTVGDVLLHSRGIEKLAAVDRRGVTGEKLFVLRSKDESRLLQRFLPWLLMSSPAQRHMKENFTGSVNKFLNWRPLANFEFDLPPLSQQERISDLCWAIEAELRATSEVIGAAHQVRAMVRDSLFDNLTATFHSFESVCAIPSQNGVALKKSERAGTVPMVNMGEMFKGEAISSAAAYERVMPPGDTFLLAPGDLLFARRSIVFEGAGTCCLVPDLNEPFTFESSVIRSRVADSIDPQFALHFFRSARGRQAMSQIIRRGPISGISGADLRKLKLPVPELAAQRAIVRQIAIADSIGPSVVERNRRAELLLSSVLVQVFGGN